MTTFRDAVQQSIETVAPPIDDDASDAVLATPEMQAIRGALQRMADYIGPYQGLPAVEVMHWYLSDSPTTNQHVIDWVLGTDA
jgi:hypothetical protein